MTRTREDEADSVAFLAYGHAGVAVECKLAERRQSEPGNQVTRRTSHVTRHIQPDHQIVFVRKGGLCIGCTGVEQADERRQKAVLLHDAHTVARVEGEEGDGEGGVEGADVVQCFDGGLEGPGGGRGVV